jgi:hypothetical protein
MPAPGAPVSSEIGPYPTRDRIVIQHLHSRSESHREVNIPSLDTLAESVCNENHSDKDQKCHSIARIPGL